MEQERGSDGSGRRGADLVNRVKSLGEPLLGGGPWGQGRGRSSLRSVPLLEKQEERLLAGLRRGATEGRYLGGLRWSQAAQGSLWLRSRQLRVRSRGLATPSLLLRSSGCLRRGSPGPAGSPGCPVLVEALWPCCCTTLTKFSVPGLRFFICETVTGPSSTEGQGRGHSGPRARNAKLPPVGT